MSKEIEANTTLSHYRILLKLGAGGMGEVYLAQDTKLDRRVAIKFLSAELGADERARRRLIGEARAAAKLDHPNICTIHEVGEADGHCFIVMQYVEGETLSSRAAREPLELREVLDIAVQVSEALSEAHSRGIIHRDIKPQNIMITARGQTKVMDFGLAKVLRGGPIDESQVETVLTESGGIVGTVPYMSPEQLHGEDLDGRTDIFSFGAVLYEMISGRQPFIGRGTGAIISAILTKEPNSLLGLVPEAIEEIVRKCLEKDRERRYQTMRDLANDLNSVRSECGTGPASRSEATTVKTEATTDPVVTNPGFIAAKRRLLAAGLAILVVAALAYAMLFRSARAVRQPQIKSLAVLPLENLSGDPAQEYFADGMTEAIIGNLAQIGALRVVSRTSVMRFKGSSKPLPEIAQELNNVDAVIVGSVQRVSGRVKISAQLIQAATDTHLWARDYEREVTDILKLQGEVARAVADEIRIQVTAEERARLAVARSVNPQAHESYLLGRYHLWRHNEEDLKLSIGHFERATQLDADYAAAWAGLSMAWTERGIWGMTKSFLEVEPASRNAALKAIALDAGNAEAHTSLAQLKKIFEWDWAGAEQEFRHATALDPGSAEGHRLFADLLMALGRHAEAISEMQTVERLDPLSALNQSTFGRVLYRARNYEEAERRLKRALELDSRDYGIYGRLGDTFEQMGRYAEAIESLEKAESLRSDSGSGGGRGYTARLARVYARMGRRGEASRMLKGLQRTTEPRFPKLFAAAAWAALDDKDEAFKLLFSAIEERNELIIFIKEDPPFDGLHSDPRWKDLLRRMNFPTE
jgi:eukaryotic-like serine/threonine-protein kinase